MIGGYVGTEPEGWINNLIVANPTKHIATVCLSQYDVQGYLFYTAGHDEQKHRSHILYLSPELAAISDDFLVVGDAEEGGSLDA